MSLITLFICLAIIKLTTFHSNVNLSKIWPKSSVKWLQSLQLPNPWLFLALLFAPILLATGLIYGGFINSDAGYQLIGLIFSGVVLWLCLGPYVLVANSQSISAKEFFARINQRLFGLVFWFVILGPVGAIFYRLSIDFYELSKENESPLANAQTQLTQLIALLDYIPIRITILVYALAGDFNHCFSYWISHFFGKISSNTEFLVKGSLIAVGMDGDDIEQSLNSEVQSSAIHIIERGLAIILIVILIFMFGGLIL